MSQNPNVEEITTESSGASEIDESSYSALLESISGLAKELEGLSRLAVRQYTPVVNAILRSHSRDIRHIEHTLDRLLDFCGYQPAVLLYRKLCRYYFDIDRAATVGYINAYREMWDSEAEENEL